MATKTISLTKGEFALVDDEDFDQLNNWKWHCSNGYARRREGGRKNGRYIYMHRQLLNFPSSDIDHIDRNPLNNQKENLRMATRSENLINTNLRQDNISGYKGIYWNSERQKWQVQIGINKKIIALGRFLLLEDAIQARKNAEKKYHV